MGEAPPDLAPPTGGADMAAAGPAQSLLSGGLVQAVSTEQTQLAYVQNPSTVSGVPAGTLTVSSLPVSGNDIAVADNAFAASFPNFPSVGSNDALVYSTGPTPSVDAAQTTVYGALGVWLPGMSKGVQLSKGFAATRANPPDNSSVLFWDTPAASNQGSGDVMLARLAECTPNACARQTLAAGVTVAAMAISPDGKYGAYAVRNAGPPVSFDVYLVTIATGAVRPVATGASRGSISFSPDGALLASIGPAFALQVTSTATGAPATWGAMPAASKSFTVSFATSTTLLVSGQAMAEKTVTVYKTTASAAAAPITSGPATLAMVVPRNSGLPTGTARYLFTSMAPVSGVGDVQAFDLTAATPAAIPIASKAALGSIAISFDQTYARVLESYDPTTQTGTLTLAALPGGTLSTLPAGVTPAGVAFAHMHALLYIDPTSANTLTEWSDGNKTTFATGVSAFRVRSGLVYFSVGTADTLYGYAPGILDQSLSP